MIAIAPFAVVIVPPVANVSLSVIAIAPVPLTSASISVTVVFTVIPVAALNTAESAVITSSASV